MYACVGERFHVAGIVCSSASKRMQHNRIETELALKLQRANDERSPRNRD